MQKNKNIEFFGFSKCRFFAPRNLFEAPVRAPTKPKKLARKPFFQKWLKPRAKPQSEQDIEKKKAHKEPKQAKQRTKQVRTTMQRERRESKTSKATNKQARTTQNNEH